MPIFGFCLFFFLHITELNYHIDSLWWRYRPSPNLAHARTKAMASAFWVGSPICDPDVVIVPDASRNTCFKHQKIMWSQNNKFILAHIILPHTYAYIIFITCTFHAKKNKTNEWKEQFSNMKESENIIFITNTYTLHRKKYYETDNLLTRKNQKCF